MVNRFDSITAAATTSLPVSEYRTTALALTHAGGPTVDFCRFIYVHVGHDIPYPQMFAAHKQQWMSITALLRPQRRKPCVDSEKQALARGDTVVKEVEEAPV